MDTLVQLQGYKTYIVLVLAALIWLAEVFGFLPPDLAISAYQILVVLGGATVAAKINRLKNGK